MTLQTPDAVIEELKRLIGSRWAEGTQDMETTVILDALPTLLADHAAMRAEIERLKKACSKMNEEISQTLGRALGYPRFGDDPKNFPDMADDPTVAVGDHVAETLADEAAAWLAKLKGRGVA